VLLAVRVALSTRPTTWLQRFLELGCLDLLLHPLIVLQTKPTRVDSDDAVRTCPAHPGANPLHRDRACRCHICAGTGVAAATSARDQTRPAHFCTGTGLTNCTLACVYGRSPARCNERCATWRGAGRARGAAVHQVARKLTRRPLTGRAPPAGDADLRLLHHALRTAPGLGSSPLAPGMGSPLVSGLGSPLPHLHQDQAHPCHICARTRLTLATSVPGLGSPPPHCAGTLSLPSAWAA
jgi:hypothetical protein